MSSDQQPKRTAPCLPMDECRCPCHNVIAYVAVSHVVACCDGMMLLGPEGIPIPEART